MVPIPRALITASLVIALLSQNVVWAAHPEATNSALASKSQVSELSNQLYLIALVLEIYKMHYCERDVLTGTSKLIFWDT